MHTTGEFVWVYAKKRTQKGSHKHMQNKQIPLKNEKATKTKKKLYDILVTQDFLKNYFKNWNFYNKVLYFEDFSCEGYKIISRIYNLHFQEKYCAF